LSIGVTEHSSASLVRFQSWKLVEGKICVTTDRSTFCAASCSQTYHLKYAVLVKSTATTNGRFINLGVCCLLIFGLHSASLDNI